MSGNPRFWLNAAIIGFVHAVVLLGLARWSGSARKPATANIVWMDGSAATLSATAASVPVAAVPEIPEPSPAPTFLEEPAPVDNSPDPAPKSEIELSTPAPTATATPRPTPTATATPNSTPRATPKLTPRPTPKKAAKASPTPRPAAAPREKNRPEIEGKKASPNPSPVDETSADPSKTKSEPTTGSAGSAAAGASQAALYGSMLHDRFFSEWVQPKSVVMSGAKMSALVRLRIERDGRVSEFVIVRPSGNVVVDESVAAVAKRVTRVDPLPAGLGNGAYEVKINFELNPEE